MEKKRCKRGRPALPYKTHICYVRIPDPVFDRLKQWTEENHKGISEGIVECVKFFLGIK